MNSATGGYVSSSRSSRHLIFVLALFAILSIPLEIAFAWDGGGKATYIGGSIPGLPDEAKGRIDTTHRNHFQFASKKVDVEIPWERINMIEYGQKVGRRIGLAILVSPVFLMAKSRKHFLTINFEDADDRQQALVFQLDKDHVRSIVITMEARTGLRVEFQDDEARFGGESQ